MTGDPHKPGRLDRYAYNKKRSEGADLKAEVVRRRVKGEVPAAVTKDLDIILNFHGALSRGFSDLLWVEQPGIYDDTANTEAHQTFLDEVTKRSRFFTQGAAVTMDMSRYGTGLWRVRSDDDTGLSIIEAQPTYLGTGSAWFPIHAPLNVKQITHHVLAYQQTETVVVARRRVQRLVLTALIFHKGSTEVRKMLITNGKIAGHLDGTDLKPKGTSVDDFLLFPVHNIELSDTLTGIDDYRDIDGLVVELEKRLGKVSSILDYHAKPKMYGPAGVVQTDSMGQASVPEDMDYYPVDDGEKEPGYIVWDAGMEAVWSEIDHIMELLYIISETSPAMFGQVKEGLAESGSALKRLLVKPLIHVARLCNAHNEALPHVFQAAADLERANGVSNGVGELNVQIEWQDGLPQDMTEAVAVETQAVTARLTTRKAAAGRLYGLRGKALDDYMAEIDKEQEADKPPAPTFQVKPNPAKPGEEPEDQPEG